MLTSLRAAAYRAQSARRRLARLQPLKTLFLSVVSVAKLPRRVECVLASIDIRYGFQALALEEVKQLLRRAARLLVARFPLAHGRDTGVEDRCQHGLTQAQVFAQARTFLASYSCIGSRHSASYLRILRLSMKPRRYKSEAVS